MNEFFNDNFLKPFDFYSFKVKGPKGPSANFSETKTLYKLDLECPGYKPADVLVELEGNRLYISACQSSQQEEKDSNYIFQERSSSSFSRAFTLPEDAKLDSVACKMQDGLLKIKIKKQKTRSRKKQKLTVMES